MMTYKFICIDDESNGYGPGRHIEHVITGEQTWVDLLSRFEEWLRGVGYVFDGQLEMVKD
jgi:hypothetical protein